MKYELVVGIPVFNRKKILSYFSRSLLSAIRPNSVKFFIIDDGSSELSFEQIKEMFPSNFDFFKNEKNSGNADTAIRNLLAKCTDYDADYALLLDSDMLVASDFLQKIKSYLPMTDGILSVFNTNNHPLLSEENDMLIKNTIGSAGTIFKMELAKQIIDNIEDGPSFDFRYCDFLKQKSIRLFCMKNSLIQHIGFNSGQNSSGRNGDIGIGFSDTNPSNAYLLTEYLLFDIQEREKDIHHKKLSVKMKKIRNKIRLQIKKVLN